MQKLYPRILDADAIVMASPTYFYNVTSDIKAFIERFYCFQVFDTEDRSVWSSFNEALGGKYAVVISICEQQDDESIGFTPEAMAKPLEGLGYRVISNVKILNLFEKEDVHKNELAFTQVKGAGKRLRKSLLLQKKILQNLDDIKQPLLKT